MGYTSILITHCSKFLIPIHLIYQCALITWYIVTMTDSGNYLLVQLKIRKIDDFILPSFNPFPSLYLCEAKILT